MVSETNLDDSFPTGQYLNITNRLDRNGAGGRNFNLYSRRYPIKANNNARFNRKCFSVEMNLRKTKWLFCFSNNPQNISISTHMESISKVTDLFSVKYENLTPH